MEVDPEVIELITRGTAQRCRNSVCPYCAVGDDPRFDYKAPLVYDRWFHEVTTDELRAQAAQDHTDPQAVEYIACDAGPIIEAFGLVAVKAPLTMGVNTGAYPSAYGQTGDQPYSLEAATPPPVANPDIRRPDVETQRIQRGRFVRWFQKVLARDDG